MYRARLHSKPNAELSYSVYHAPAKGPSRPSPPRLVVFLNNLLMPASSWELPITLSTQRRASADPEFESGDDVPILTYDRFGQGLTPSPFLSSPSGYTHDFSDVVSDLRSLITVLLPQLFPYRTSIQTDNVHLLLIGASIGAPLARLYAETYPRTVAGIILLDSNIANRSYSSFWPDPSAPNFDPEIVVAPDCTLEQYLEATKALAAMFDLDVKNREGLDRRNTPQLLPYADRPKLFAPLVEGTDELAALTKVLVVGHDPEAFAEEGFERMGTPKSFTKKWLQKDWDKYNLRLLNIGDSTAFGGKVRIAEGCGHFIQRDDPGFVAGVVEEMLEVLGW